MRTAKRILADSLLVAGIAIVVGLAGLNVLAWRGELVEERQADTEPMPPSAASSSAGADPAEPDPSSSARADAAPAAASAPAAAAETTGARVVVLARRGDSYLEVRAGSSTGRVRWSGILRLGDEARVSGEKLWLRLGAPSNVDVSVNSKPAPSLPGIPANVIATADGVRIVSLG